jgi:tetratricopeptide (TPR) repeat protein
MYDQFKLSALFNKGLILKIFNENESALFCFKVVHEIDPNNTDCISELFWCHTKMENYNYVIPLGILLLRNNHECQQVWFSLGHALMQVGFFQSSLYCIERILTKTLSDQETWYMKGLLFSSIRDFSGELSCYFVSSIINHSHRNTNLNTMLCLINLKRYDEAILSNKNLQKLTNFSKSFHEITDRQIRTLSYCDTISYNNRVLLDFINIKAIKNVFDDKYPEFAVPRLIAFLLISIKQLLGN